ncbi:MAG: TonB-dependent receptor [Sphingomonas sp.]|nr:TonB-dependent receptor [Sphingomonas sp.]
MTNFARSLYATSSSHVAMGVALAVLGAAPAFGADLSAEASAAAAAVAQEPATRDSTEATTADEEIVVTGIRASIAASVAEKKANSSIVEVISAEDIGKLPDQSIAESLSRLPGLATQRLDGRASVVSIRGLAPDFTTTLLNGREQVSASNNRGVELDQYPSELINGAIVYKTPDASLIGQALGGTIDMKTVRPLAYGRRAIALGARFEVNDLGELNPDVSNKGYRANISYIDQNADGTVGWAIGYARMVSPTAEERWQAWGYPTFNWQDNQAVYGWDPDGDGVREIRPEYEAAQGQLLIGGAKPYVKSNKLTRDGLMGVLEFQPNEQWHVTLDGYWSKFKDDQRLRGLELPFWWGGQGETLGPDYTVEDGLITSGSWNNVKAVMRNDVVHRTSKIFAGGLNVEFRPTDRLELEGDASFSKLRTKIENIEIYAGTGRGSANGARDTMDFVLGSDGVIEFTPNDIDYTDDSLFQLTDPRGWCGRPGFPGDCQDGFINAPRIKDQLASLRLQATQEMFENDSLRVGLNYSHREKTLDDEGYVLTHENYPANTPIPDDLLFDPVSLDFIGIPGMVSFDSWKYLNQGHYTLTPESLWTSSRLTNSFEITEKVLTGFVQYNLDRHLGSVPVRGNVGVQIVHSDQEGNSFSASRQGDVVVVEPITDGDSYTDVLPSLNLAFEIAQNNFIRVGAARVLARARMDQLNPANGFSFDASKAANTTIDSSPWSGTAGNAKLKPLIANAFDLAYENYFGQGGYVALSGFYKDLESFIYRQQSVFDFTGYPHGGPVTPTFFQGFVSQWQNAGGGKVYGAELSSSLPFNALSSALDGFGILVSGSYTKSKVRLGDEPTTTMPGLSKWVVNSTFYYEKHGFNARVSGRYRSKFLAEVSGLSLVRDLVFAKSEFLVDAQIGYEFRRGPLTGLSILASGYNLTNEPFVTYQNGDTRQIRDHQNYGRNFMLGFAYKF